MRVAQLLGQLTGRLMVTNSLNMHETSNFSYNRMNGIVFYETLLLFHRTIFKMLCGGHGNDLEQTKAKEIAWKFPQQ
jgi:hypothetical protein